MVRFLQSAWMTMLLGGLLFFATTAALLKPGKFQGAIAAPVEKTHAVSNEPSWKFRNPEMDQWIEEIKHEKEALATREQQLKELETRLNAERQEISVVTQAVHQMQTDFDKNVVRLKSEDTANLKRQTKLLLGMSPEGAVATLSAMNDDDVVRILYTMKSDEASLTLDNLGKGGKEQAKRAASLFERLRHIIPPTTTAQSN